ncbi:MAG: hypothetical protein D6761_02085 [Candidatus Dadabacteria bacterium]|nr:MAG: hypothetical protein D6761_02085 [Candidatus Dadabacteria bacterium]
MSSRRRIAGLVLRYRWPLFIACLALGIVFGLLAARLKLTSNLAALLPEDYVSVQTAKLAKERVGGFETLQILVEGASFPAMVSYAAAIAEVLEGDELVQAVDWKKPVEFFERNALLYAPVEDLELILRRVYDRIDQVRAERSPLAEYRRRATGATAASQTAPLSLEELENRYRVTDQKRYYTNADRSILVLNIYPAGSNTNVGFARKFFHHVRAVVEGIDTSRWSPDLFVEYGGNFKNKIDEYEVIISDVTSSAGISISLVFLVIVLYFRQIFAVFVVGLPLVVGIAWTFGLTWLVIGRLNTLTVFLFIVLFGLGIDYGIHLLARYFEGRRSGAPPEQALAETIDHVWTPFLTAAATTGAAFLSLTLSDFKGFYEFGFIAGSGVLLTMASTILLSPTTILLAERWRLFFGQGWKRQRETPRPVRLPRRLSRLLVLAIVVSALWGGWQGAHMEFQYDFTDLRAQLPASRAVKKKLKTIFKESNSPAIVLTDSLDDLAEIDAWVRQRIRTDPTPTIHKFKSIYTFLPKEQERKLRLIRRLRELLTDERVAQLSGEEARLVRRLVELANVQPIGIDDLPEAIRRLFRARDGRLDRFGLIYPAVALKDGRNALMFNEDVATFTTASGKTFHAVNSSIIFADMLRMMMREGEQAMALTFLTVLLLVVLDLRSWRAAAMVMTPLVVGFCWLFLDMSIEGLQINFFNMVVLPSILGIGIDNGVHLYHRYRELGPGHAGLALRLTGGAISTSSGTSIVGFAGLMFAHHGGLKAIGDLAVRGIALTLLAALVALPALMVVLEGWRAKRDAWGEHL